jgi:hypothetical protein
VSTFDNGLVLVSEGAQPAMLAFAIGDGPNASTIYGAKWASGSWSGWQAFTPDSASKTSLAGSGCGSAHPMIFWTEPGSPQTIVGADVSAFFP